MKRLTVRSFALLMLLAVLLGATFAVTAGPTQAAASEPGVGHPAAPSGTGCSYYVQYGDSLSSIALRYGTTWTAIAKVNGLANPNFIYVGQRLAIPCSGSVASGGQLVSNRQSADLGATSRPSPTKL